MNHLNKLIIGDKFCDNILYCLFYTLEMLNFKLTDNYKIYNTIETLFLNYKNHYNLNETDLWDCAHKYTSELICKSLINNQ